MNPYVPMDTGTLANDSVRIIANEKSAEVHYNTPYAAKMYYGDKLNFSKEKHPLASSHWDIEAMKSGREKLAAAVSEYIKRKRG